MLTHLNTDTKSRLSTMDWTVKDHECWEGLFQGLHVDYTGSYAFFTISIDVGV